MANFCYEPCFLKKIHRSRANKYVIPVPLHKSARLNNFKPSGMICYYFFPSVFLSFSLFHSRLNFIDRISWLSVLCKNKFPQIKITAQFFPAKTYSRGNTVRSNLNSLHKNTPLPNHMYFETDFKVFKMYFQYLNTIFLYFNPIWQKNLNFRPCLKYILSVVKLYFMKTKTSLINLQCILFNKYD